MTCDQNVTAKNNFLRAKKNLTRHAGKVDHTVKNENKIDCDLNVATLSISLDSGMILNAHMKGIYM